MTRLSPIRSRARAFPPHAQALCALLMVGCGGGDAADDPAAQGRALPQGEAVADVRLEGCLLDVHARPAAGRTIHARIEGGRLVATAHSGPDGVFVVRVPAHASIALDTLLDGRCEVVLLTGSTPVSVGACLWVEGVTP